LSSISTTIIGEAKVVERGSEEERWCKEQHLENNTFASDEGERRFSTAGLTPETTTTAAHQTQAGREGSAADDDVRVVTVRVKEGRIADWKGGVRDWVIADDGARADDTLMNGVP
jgi:hypothetical protein